MSYTKRQIIEVNFPIGDKIERHPAVILSANQVYSQESFYLCAMITSNQRYDSFSFKILDHHTTKTLQKRSQVRTHLISQILQRDILKSTPINHFTMDAFLYLIDHIDEHVFEIEYEI